MTAPHDLSLGEPGIRPMNIAEPTWDAWRSELAGIGGPSPLLHFVDGPRTRIELAATHPGGLTPFIGGNTVLLSSLIRDDVALRAAKLAAAEIAAKGVELAAARGIDAVNLGIGLAEWQFEGVEFCAPILLRPLAIRRRGDDFELRLRGPARLNPALVSALHGQFGLTLDHAAFLALAEQDGAFKPNAVIDKLRGLTGHLDWFNVQPRLIVSSFADVATAIRDDAGDLAHPVLDALAGNPGARWSVEGGYAPVQPTSPDVRGPETDTLLLDADAEQENVVAQIAAGNSIVVETLPGTGGTQTIVNALGCLVAQNKRVLVTSPRRATLADIGRRLADIGLPGLAVTQADLRRDLIRSISRNEKAARPKLDEIDGALVRLRKVLLDYRGAIDRKDPVLGISVLDCLTELSRLALLPEPPETSVRLSPKAVASMAEGRDRAASIMVEAARLGEFRYGPGDTPWYGAHFDSPEAATRAHGIASQLHHTELPRLLQRANALVADARMRPVASLIELGAYLRLLGDIRDTLDKFLPVVFDRSLADLIAATSPRREAGHLKGAQRRRLKALAREYLRPGAQTSDLNGALRAIQAQRLLWQRFAPEGVPPEIPVGIGDLQVHHQQVTQDLTALDAPLGLAPGTLAGLPIPELIDRVAGLAAESDALHNLQERAVVLGGLRDYDLDPLLADLANRHVPEERIPAELEVAWWRSALAGLLEAERALLGANTDVLDRLEADFRMVDGAHAAGSAQRLAWQLAGNWKVGLDDEPEEAAALKKLLRGERVASRDLQELAPRLTRTLAPVWLASPYEVPQIADSLRFDAVLVVDAGAITVAESIGAIRRARQVVVFGDPVIQTPTPFRIGLGHETEAADEEALDAAHRSSLLAALGELLPTLSLTMSYRAGGEDLAELVNRRFYGGRIRSVPWAGSFLGHGSIRVDRVEDGTGLPDPDTGAVESVDGEVAHVVRLVLDHAAERPRESLMVITASSVHAVRVQQAVLVAIANRPELHDFLLGDRPEPFTVTTIEQAVAQSRDRVIFSIGYGRTPHGRVLSDLGELGTPGGERLLAIAMTRARRSMVIVTCFEAADMDVDRMQHGAVVLGELLEEIQARESSVPVPDDSDPLLVDLARRLEVRGLRVALGHRGKLGLVTAHQGMCLTIETDTVLHTRSLRESLRLRPELLRRLGWHYLRVYAFELFRDPDAVADRVVAMLGAERAPVTEPIPVPARAS